MKMKKRFNTCTVRKMSGAIVCCLLFAFSFVLHATATATGGKGFAIYHANAFLVTFDWHSGLMYLPDINSVNAIVHEGKADSDSGSNDHPGVNRCSKARFLNLQPFCGYYRPAQYISPAARNIVAEKANQLTNYSIGYSLGKQMEYTSSLSGNKVENSEITKIRCDGVVEYCYEYYGYKIFGIGNKDDWATQRELWDISFKNTPASVHSISHVTPKKQAEYYMVNMLGDVNADCVVNAQDARIVLRYAVNQETPNTFQSFVANVDGNGIINSNDAQLILKYATHQISVFPADPINNINL